MSRKKICKDVMIKLLNKYNVSVEKKINDIENKMYINKFPIYIINLREDIIRRNYIRVIMEKMNINYELVIVERIQEEDYQSIKNRALKKITKGMFGCFLSHMWCLQNAIKNDYSKFIIFEDDIIFHKNFHSLFEEIIEKNKDIDILRLGSCDFHFKENIKTLHDNIYIPVQSACGTHGILFSKSFAKKIFDYKLQNIQEYDTDLTKIGEYYKIKHGICFPNLVCAELSTTNIDHNYSFESEEDEKLYYKYCFQNKFNFHDYHFIYLSILNDGKDCKDCKDYKEYIYKVLLKYPKKIQEKLKKRLLYNFFILSDIIKITNNNND
jgi:GR25 family glycosyltransferase involved in LPS biosynthesis